MANEKQVAYWNEVAGPKWVRLGDAMESRLVEANRLLLAHAAPQPGERVLDIGCGTGVSALPLVRAVGPAGSVTGIDISTPMLDVARARCAGQTNIHWMLADAQVHDFAGGQTFDLLASRFGVMFFGEPVAAFANLRGTMAPGGRLCFVCWAGLAENPHWRIPFEIAVAALGPPEPKPPRAPGPMALSEPHYVMDILKSSGFADVSVDPVVIPMIGETIAEDARISGFMGPAGALMEEKQVDAATRAVLEAAFAAAIAPYDTPAGPRLPATVLLVQAR